MTKNRTRHRRPVLRIVWYPDEGRNSRGVDSPYFEVQVGAYQPVYMTSIESVERWINANVTSGRWSVEHWAAHVMFIYPTVHNASRNQPLNAALARSTAKAMLRFL